LIKNNGGIFVDGFKSTPLKRSVNRLTIPTEKSFKVKSASDPGNNPTGSESGPGSPENPSQKILP
jgi:hypothetical protein